MQINVEAENVRLWINEHKRSDGSTWNTYSISTSSKDQEGGFINKALEVRMTREVQIPNDIENGALVTIRGSLSNRAFTGKDGERRVEHMLWAHEIDFDKPYELKGESADSFEKLDEDVPF